MNEISVCVLMATYNGELYLKEQLDSILDQSHKTTKVLISDDGSTDRTREIAMEYANKYPSRIAVIDGPRSGLESNFYSLIEKASSFDLYAFADQDDVWERNKLARAVEFSLKYPRSTPFVYCGATILIDEKSNIIRKEERSDVGRIGLRHALGYNIATGNTIVFNDATRSIVPAEIKDIDPLGHDWLIFLYALMFGGNVVYDDFPTVLYRIHSANNSSIKSGVGGRISLLWHWVFGGKLKKTNRRIIDSLELVSKRASPEVNATLEKFKSVHRGNLFQRIRCFRELAISRKNKSTNWINWVAVTLGRF